MKTDSSSVYGVARQEGVRPNSLEAVSKVAV